MTVDDVASFVTDAGFEELARMFTKDDVTGKNLQKDPKALSDEYDLNGLDQVRLLVKIKEKQNFEFGGTCM